MWFCMNCPICDLPMELRFEGLEICWWWCEKCKAEALVAKEKSDAKGNISTHEEKDKKG